MRYLIAFDEAAEGDVEAIHEYLLSSASEAVADRMLGQILEVIEALEQNPLRGAMVPETLALGSQRYRQVHSKPYRIVYSVRDKHVIILVVGDGRRNFASLLAERLLASPF